MNLLVYTVIIDKSKHWWHHFSTGFYPSKQLFCLFFSRFSKRLRSQNFFHYWTWKQWSNCLLGHLGFKKKQCCCHWCLSRKPTPTDRYLDFSSHHDIKHKISTASTLLFRASSLPSNHEGKTRETNHDRATLEANGYPSTVISNILNKKPPSPTVPPPKELVSVFFKWVEPSDTYKGFACLPYISSLTEPLTRLLRNNEIRVVNKPFKTLQKELPSPKFRQPSDLQCNVVYKIPCKDCPWNYTGETGKMLPNPKKERKRNLKNYATGSNVW